MLSRVMLAQEPVRAISSAWLAESDEVAAVMARGPPVTS